MKQQIWNTKILSPVCLILLAGAQSSQTPDTNSDRCSGGFDGLRSVLCAITGGTRTNVPHGPTVHTPIISKKNVSRCVSFPCFPFLLCFSSKERVGFSTSGGTARLSFLLKLRKAVKRRNSFCSLSYWVTSPERLLRVIKVKLHPLSSVFSWNVSFVREMTWFCPLLYS